MSAVIVEHARFVEVRQRRERMARDLTPRHTHPPTDPSPDVSDCEPADDKAVAVALPHSGATVARGVVDVG